MSGAREAILCGIEVDRISETEIEVEVGRWLDEFNERVNVLNEPSRVDPKPGSGVDLRGFCAIFE